MRQARLSTLAHANGAASVPRGSDAIAMSLRNDLGQTATSDGSRPSDPRLHRALENLSLAERSSIEAALIHGLSYSEVAERQRQSVGSIKKAISSGLAKLRHQLQQPGANA
jgi:DNA-directed RNA polymerase specialized sigma24 family protein